MTVATVLPSAALMVTCAFGSVLPLISVLSSAPLPSVSLLAIVMVGVAVFAVLSRESATPSTLAATIPTAPAASRPPVSQGQMAALVSVAPIHHGVETAPPPNA